MKTILYLGIEPPHDLQETNKVIHYPIIKTIPRGIEECTSYLNQFLSFTHIIFTSKTSVAIFFQYLQELGFSKSDFLKKNYITVGKATARALYAHGIENVMIAQNETAEGVIEVLDKLALQDSFICWPHSALSRNVLTNYFSEKNLRFSSCILYDTIPFKEGTAPNFDEIDEIDEIVFTSSSTVDAFLSFFNFFPSNITLTAIGPITKAKLDLECKKSFV